MIGKTISHYKILENLSGNPEQEYLVDGMHDAIIGELARVRALKVVSRTP